MNVHGRAAFVDGYGFERNDEQECNYVIIEIDRSKKNNNSSVHAVAFFEKDKLYTYNRLSISPRSNVE